MTRRRHAITDAIDEGLLDGGAGHSIHWTLSGQPAGRLLPDAELFDSETEGHGGTRMVDWMIGVLDRLAERPTSPSGP